MRDFEPRERYFKKFVVGTVFAVLGRGMKGVVKVDSKAKEYFDELKDGFVFRLCVLPSGPALVLKKENGHFVSVKKREANNIKIDLDIQFKNLQVALPVVLGMAGVSQGYAENRFILKGEIADSMRIVDLINLTEAYLFPKFITKKFMDVIPKKQKSSLRVYLYVLAGI